MTSFATAKKAAALKSLDFVKDGMTLGLGTGSTATFLIDGLIEKVNQGLNVTCVASSKRSAEQAVNGGIKVIDINDTKIIDLTIDGADEVDSKFNLIKGGGGALTREKILATNSREMIVIVDDSKISENLGRFALPVEIIPFGYKKTQEKLSMLGLDGLFRENFVTDNGNFILDMPLNEGIKDLNRLNSQILEIVGVVETGFFLDIAKIIIIGKNDGRSEIKF